MSLTIVDIQLLNSLFLTKKAKQNLKSKVKINSLNTISKHFLPHRVQIYHL